MQSKHALYKSAIPAFLLLFSLACGKSSNQETPATQTPGANPSTASSQAPANNASQGKTTGPRFDTLIVRGAPAKGSRKISAYNEILYDGKRAGSACFEGAVQEKWAPR